MENLKAKLTGAILLFIMIMLVPMIVLAVTNEKVQIISNTDDKGNKQYIVYIQEQLKNNFLYAISNSTDTPLTYETASTDGEGNYVAVISEADVKDGKVILHIDDNTQEPINLDFSTALDREDMNYVENTTIRIGTKITENLVEVDEEIDGVQTKLTVGGLQITDTDNATYQYQITKATENTKYSRLVELVNNFNSEIYNQKDMYSKIQLTSEFYNLYNQLINEATWTDVSNKEIRQPNDAITGDQYVVLIRKTAEDGTVTTDAKIMVAALVDWKDEDSQTREIKETAKLPITGDSIILIVALIMVVIALIIVFTRMKKLNKKEDK